MKQPSIDLGAYDRRAKMTDKVRDLQAVVANEGNEKVELETAIGNLEESLKAAPGDDNIKSEISRLKARLAGLAETYNEPRAALATATRELDIAGGPIPTEAQREKNRIIDETPAKPKPADDAVPETKLSKAITESLARFDGFAKRARNQAGAIAKKDIPEAVALAELEQLFRRQ